MNISTNSILKVQGKILITGAAGFIGFHMSRRLLAEGFSVVGIDNMNNYYDVKLKQKRLQQLSSAGIYFHEEFIEDEKAIEHIFRVHQPEIVIHLAAQAGIGANPDIIKKYVDSNLVGFVNVLENCRKYSVKKVLYASSSSVYGANAKLPNSVHDSTNHPLSLYAATKKANELMAHSYSHLYGLPTVGLRFFNAYGPWGRPDMALFLFTKAILSKEPINIYNYGQSKRDFTYVDDIVECIFRLIHFQFEPNARWDALQPDPATSRAPYKIYNLGNQTPVKVEDMINILEEQLGENAIRCYLPANAYDVPASQADIDLLYKDIKYRPDTPIQDGIRHFVKWYRENYYVSSMHVNLK